MENLDPSSELGAILKRRKQIFLTVGSDDDKERKTVENLRYKPFQENVYNDWSSATTIEVVDILDKVTRAQKYKVN